MISREEVQKRNTYNIKTVKKAGIFLSSELSSFTTLNLRKAIGNAKLFEDFDMVELGFCSLLPTLFAFDLGGLGG